MSLGQKKIVRAPETVISAIKFPGTLAMSKIWQILADDLPAPVRYPGSSADFVQKKTHQPGDFSVIDVNVTAIYYENTTANFQTSLKIAGALKSKTSADSYFPADDRRKCDRGIKEGNNLTYIYELPELIKFYQPHFFIMTNLL